MIARFMDEGIGTDNGLVRLYRKASNGGEQAGAWYDPADIDTGFELIDVPARSPCPLILHSTSPCGLVQAPDDGHTGEAQAEGVR